MSQAIQTRNKGILEQCGFSEPYKDTVFVGEYEVDLEEFCDFAAGILSGGLNGWPRREIPVEVEELLVEVNRRLGRKSL